MDVTIKLQIKILINVPNLIDMYIYISAFKKVDMWPLDKNYCEKNKHIFSVIDSLYRYTYNTCML